MNYTINVTPLKDTTGALKANASLILEDCFKITGIRIGISKEGKTFVAMPDFKTGKLDDKGKDIYQDIAYPVTRQFRQELYAAIVQVFDEQNKTVQQDIGIEDNTQTSI